MHEFWVPLYYWRSALGALEAYLLWSIANSKQIGLRRRIGF